MSSKSQTVVRSLCKRPQGSEGWKKFRGLRELRRRPFKSFNLTCCHSSSDSSDTSSKLPMSPPPVAGSFLQAVSSDTTRDSLGSPFTSWGHQNTQFGELRSLYRCRRRADKARRGCRLWKCDDVPQRIGATEEHDEAV